MPVSKISIYSIGDQLKMAKRCFSLIKIAEGIAETVDRYSAICEQKGSSISISESKLSRSLQAARSNVFSSRPAASPERRIELQDIKVRSDI